MALTPQIRAFQAGVSLLTQASPALRVSQAGVIVLAIYPTEFVLASQGGVSVLTEANTTLRVSQAGIMIVARGRVADPNLRAWAFWLDSHWFYVLRLPTGITLIHDLTTEQWHIWGSGDNPLWRAFHGTNWLGAGPLAAGYGSNVVVGDDGNGALYFLDPYGHMDDDAIFGDEVPREYLREITGQIATRKIDMTSCYGVHLMGAIGEVLDVQDFNVVLFTSDDEGHSYDEHETIAVDPGEFSARVEWNSGLGSFAAPGRLFKILDRGALQRIDWLEMLDDTEDDD